MPSARSISTRLQDPRGAGWIVTIVDRTPRRGERGVWLHAPDLDVMLRELLAPALDERGRVRESLSTRPGGLRLGTLFTYAPAAGARLRGCSRLVTVETRPEQDTPRGAALRAAADRRAVAECLAATRWIPS